MSGWARMRSTASRSPWTTLNTPSGQAGLLPRDRPGASEAEGSFSLGLRTKQLPQAMALEHIHSGTMAGKLNGVMPATTPRGCSTECDVDAPGHLLGVATLQQVRGAAGELEVLQAPGHLAFGVGEHLAVLGRHHGGQFLAVGIDQLSHAEEDLGAPATARSPSRPGRRPGRP